MSLEYLHLHLDFTALIVFLSPACTKATHMIKWHTNVGFWGRPPPDNNYNDSFSFIIEPTSVFVCVLVLGDQSVSKWRVFNYEHKQTTPRTYVLVYCNDGDTMKIMSSRWALLIHRYQILHFPLLLSLNHTVKSDHHYCKFSNPICSYCFDPAMLPRHWIYMYLQ